MHVPSIPKGTRAPELVQMGQQGGQIKWLHQMEMEVKSCLCHKKAMAIVESSLMWALVRKQKPVISAVSIIAQVLPILSAPAPL